LVNGDIWTDHPFSFLNDLERDQKLAHLVLVANPAHNPNGDFCIQDGLLKLLEPGQVGYTFSGLSIISPNLIKTYPSKREKFPLVEVFRWAVEQSMITAEVYQGVWTDVGTPERLAQLQ
jgi:MurNAc alpha-1-phosphate uridylyltransferase